MKKFTLLRTRIDFLSLWSSRSRLIDGVKYLLSHLSLASTTTQTAHQKGHTMYNEIHSRCNVFFTYRLTSSEYFPIHVYH